MKEGRKEEKGRKGGSPVMIWATALLLPLALPVSRWGREGERMRAHMGTLARSRSQMGWAAVNQRGPISPSSLRRSFGEQLWARPYLLLSGRTTTSP